MNNDTTQPEPGHHFEVVQGLSGSTIMYCKQCGASYRLVIYNTIPSKAVWEKVTTETYDGTPVSISRCH